MKTTIGIAAYNHAQFLPEAIESALNQTVPCEVIVVNDGSTDQTKFVLDEYADRVKVITQTNRGLPSARNTAIMNATTEYFLPLDSDDILDPTCVERLEKVMEETKADVVAPSFVMFGLTNQPVILKMRPTLEDFKLGNRLGYCGLIKRSALLEMGGYSARMVWGWEDYHLWITLLRLRKTIVTVPEYLWRYRTKENSMYTESVKHADSLRAQMLFDHPDCI